MLNGVGGSIIAEAKERLSYVEYRAQVAYLNKRGLFHSGHQLELVLVRTAALLGYALGADADPDAFRPHMALQPLSLHQAMDQWARQATSLQRGLFLGDMNHGHEY